MARDSLLKLYVYGGLAQSGTSFFAIGKVRSLFGRAGQCYLLCNVVCSRRNIGPGHVELVVFCNNIPVPSPYLVSLNSWTFCISPPSLNIVDKLLICGNNEGIWRMAWLAVTKEDGVMVSDLIFHSSWPGFESCLCQSCFSNSDSISTNSVSHSETTHQRSYGQTTFINRVSRMSLAKAAAVLSSFWNGLSGCWG